jgi:uroporphyrin-3 C-methyltransferase
MDNKKEIDKSLPEETTDIEHSSDTDEQQTASVVKSKTGSGMAIIAILLSCGAVAASGYLFLSEKDRNQQMLSTIDSLEASLQAMREQQQRNQQQLQMNLERQHAETLSLKKSMAGLYSSIENTQQTWSVEEVHQLLQLAVDQLLVAANIDGALTALNIADRRIADYGDPELQPVRQQIAQDIASLQQIERIDLAGTSNRLHAVEQSIDQLQAGSAVAAIDKKTPTDLNSTSNADSVWQQIVQDLSGVVKIRRIDQPSIPLIPPKQQYFLRENTRALIMTARMALLRNDDEIYRNSLQQAQQWVMKYFDTENQNTRWTINELQKLAAINLNPQLPDITGSLTQLQAITEGKLN